MAKKVRKDIVYRSEIISEDMKDRILDRIKNHANAQFEGNDAILEERYYFPDGNEMTLVETTDWKQFRNILIGELRECVKTMTIRMYMYTSAKVEISRKNDRLSSGIGEYEIRLQMIEVVDFGGLFLYTYEFVGKPKLWKERVVNFS